MGGSVRGQRGGGGGVCVQLETKNIAKEVRERNSVEDSFHTNTQHSSSLFTLLSECFHANQTTAGLLVN